MKGLAIGTVLAGIAMFLWGFLYFGPLNGLGAIQTGAGTNALQEAISDAVPESGTYLIPDMGLYQSDQARAEEAHLRGPRAMLFVQKAGAPIMDPKVMILGFIHMLVVAFILGVILQMVMPGLPTFTSKVIFFAVLGLTASLWINFGHVVWWSHPAKYHVMNLIYHVVSFTIAGAILARFVKR